MDFLKKFQYLLESKSTILSLFYVPELNSPNYFESLHSNVSDSFSNENMITDYDNDKNEKSFFSHSAETSCSKEIDTILPNISLFCLNKLIMPKIEFIVMQGGGSNVIASYAVIRQAAKQNFWNLKDIKAIYGTSAGALFGLIILLGFEWDIIDKYLIDRPWEKLFTLTVDNIINSFNTSGLLSIKVIEEMFSPLFRAKDISLDITLQELFNKTGIDFHVMTTRLNNFELINLSHKSHPSWRVIDAIYASSALPMLFPPLITDNGIYADGSILVNFPLLNCINDYDLNDNTDCILGTCNSVNKSLDMITDKIKDKKEFMIIDYICYVFTALEIKLQNKEHLCKIKNQVFLNIPPMSLTKVFEVMTTKIERIRLLHHGKLQWDAFFKNTYSESLGSHSEVSCSDKIK